MATVNTKTISEFKTKLSGGGARPNLFEVTVPSFPSGIPADAWGQEEQRDFKFLCKAAQLPGSTVPSIAVPFRGRVLKVAGDRTFDDWTVTIINDESFNLRTGFEKWMDGISKLDDGTGIVNPNSYMSDAQVRQLGRSDAKGSATNNGAAGGGNVILRTYNFFDMFPTEVSAIDLSYDTGDSIEEFTVTFAYQYYAVGYGINDEAEPDQAQIPEVLATNNLV